jgi:hypothetical protein
MATNCAGVTVTWNGTSFSEVTELKVSLGGSLPLGRASTFAVDAGSIDIACLAADNISPAQYGVKSTLSITGGGITLTAKAVCQTLQSAGKVNDVARYSASFKIVKE